MIKSKAQFKSRDISAKKKRFRLEQNEMHTISYRLHYATKLHFANRI